MSSSSVAIIYTISIHILPVLNYQQISVKIATKFNLRTLKFQKFPEGACPQTPLETSYFAFHGVYFT